jgi:hypothetical protein
MQSLNTDPVYVALERRVAELEMAQAKIAVEKIYELEGRIEALEAGGAPPAPPDGGGGASWVEGSELETYNDGAGDARTVLHIQPPQHGEGWIPVHSAKP